MLSGYRQFGFGIYYNLQPSWRFWFQVQYFKRYLNIKNWKSDLKKAEVQILGVINGGY